MTWVVIFILGLWIVAGTWVLIVKIDEMNTKLNRTLRVVQASNTPVKRVDQ